jgi:xylulose-5-phosphate/fructose-6-phosphate phosphoketolase
VAPPIASLNYLLTSHVWRQDHNGFSHQDPGFIDHVVNKKADVIRVYLPPDANTLLSSPTTACAAATTSTSSSPASSRSRSG